MFLGTCEDCQPGQEEKQECLDIGSKTNALAPTRTWARLTFVLEWRHAVYSHGEHACVWGRQNKLVVLVRSESPETVQKASLRVLVCIQWDIIQDKAAGSRQRGAGWPEGGLRVQRSKVKRRNFVCVRVNDSLEPLMQFNSVCKCALSISFQKQKETQKRCLRLLMCQYEGLVCLWM